MARQGSICWNELMTPDVEKAKDFYATVLGWTYVSHPVPGGTYTLAFTPGIAEPVAGIFPWSARLSTTNDWFAYIAVDDIRLALRQTVVAGGRVLREPWPVPNVGQIAIVSDAVGANFGYIEAPKA